MPCSHRLVCYRLPAAGGCCTCTVETSMFRQRIACARTATSRRCMPTPSTSTVHRWARRCKDTHSDPPLSAPRGNRSPRRAPVCRRTLRARRRRTARSAGLDAVAASPARICPSAREPGREVGTMLGLWVRARAGSVIRARAADPGPVTRRARPREFDVASLAGVPVPQGRECDPCRARRARSGAGRGREAGEKTAWLCSPSSWGCSQAHLRARHWQGGWNGA